MPSHTSTTAVRDPFLDEVARLAEASCQTLGRVAAASGLPLAAVTGAHGGIIRVPATSVRALAATLGVGTAELMKVWCSTYAPWALELLVEPAPETPKGEAPMAESRA